MIPIIRGRMKEKAFRSPQVCRYLGFFLLLFPILMSGCMSFPTNLTSQIETSLVLRIQDFPYGWEDGPFYHEEIPDALDSFYLDFHHKQSPGRYKFSFQLTLYEDAETAWSSIPYWESKLFIRDAWPWPEEIVYKPLRSEDYLRVGCMDVLIDDKPFRYCNVLQVHDERVVFLIGNLDGEVITKDFLLAVMARVDERIQGNAPIHLDPIVVPTPYR